MTKKQLAGNDGPQPKAETLAVVHDAIAYIVAVTAHRPAARLG